MVNIDSFGFNEEYNIVSVHAVIPNPTGVHYWDRRYIKSIILATQNAYDTQNGDIKLGQEEMRATQGDYTVIYYKYGVQYLITNAPNVPDYVTDPDYDGNTELADYKELTAELNIDTTNIKVTDLFFVKVEDDGVWTDDTPCKINSPYTWSSTYNRFTMDVKGMNYLTELTRNCETPDGFIDYILNRQALDVAADCGDYTAMIARYNDMNGQSSTGSSSSRGGCGCL